MAKTLTLNRWGNSLAVRFPKKLLDQLQLDEHDQVTYTVIDHQIVLKKAHQQSKLAQRFANFDTQKYLESLDQNREVDWGAKQGREFW